MAGSSGSGYAQYYQQMQQSPEYLRAQFARDVLQRYGQVVEGGTQGTDLLQYLSENAPVHGWGRAGSPSDAVGPHQVAKQILAVLVPRDGETQEEYAARVSSHPLTRDRFPDFQRVMGIRDGSGKGGFSEEEWNKYSSLWGKAPLTQEQTAAEAAKTAEEAQRNNVTSEIQKFYDWARTPLFDANGNPLDAEVKGAMAAGTNVAQREAVNRGIQGGLAVSETQRATHSATVPLTQFRQNLAGQALGLINQRDLGLQELQLGRDKLAEEARQFDQGLASDDLMNKYAAKRSQAQGIGAAIGGGIGALGFIGGPLVGAGTMAGGAAIGGGLGGLTAGAPPPQYRPTRSSGRGY